MQRQHNNDNARTVVQAKRIRYRRMVFSRQYGAPMTAAQKEDFTARLDGLGGEYAWINHLSPESHAQGVLRFPDKVDVTKIASALGLGPEGVEPIGRDKLAFARCIKYLLHDGEYAPEAIISNIDWRAEVALLPVPAAPTLTAVTRRIFDGELSPEDVANQWPDMYLRHARKFDDAARRHNERIAEQREAERIAEQREAERIAEQREAEQLKAEQFAAWCAAADAWRKSPEGLEHARREEERAEQRRHEAAARREAEAAAEWESTRTMWAIAYVAMDNAITGDAVARKGAVGALLGKSPTYAECVAYMRDEFGWSDDECEEEIRQLRADVARTNHGSLGAWIHLADPDADAYRYLLELKRNTERYPDLYEFKGKTSNPGRMIPAAWFKELRDTSTDTQKARRSGND